MLVFASVLLTSLCSLNASAGAMPCADKQRSVIVIKVYKLNQKEVKSMNVYVGQFDDYTLTCNLKFLNKNT